LAGAGDVDVRVRVAIAQRVRVVGRIVVDRVGVIPAVRRVVDAVYVGDDDGVRSVVLHALDERARSVRSGRVPEQRREAAGNGGHVVVRRGHAGRHRCAAAVQTPYIY